MLISLRIKNLALVEDLTWEISPGFVAVTGETGAGKSVILGALKLLLGERADKSLIRTGAEACTVEGVFDLPDAAECNERLGELGLEPCEDGQLLVKRTFTQAGVNKQFVNGSPATLAVLKSVVGGMVDLHGPHDHQSLLAPEKQLLLLDAFARATAARAEYEEQFRALQSLKAAIGDLNAAEGSLERELDLLRHQAGEIREADPQPGEDTDVAARYAIAANGKRLIELAAGSAAELSESEPPILGRLAETGRQLRELARLDPAGGAAFQQSFDAAVGELEELARQLARYAERLEVDPAQLAVLEERHTLLLALKRKYGGEIESVLEFAETAEARLSRIEHRGAELERLERERSAAEAELMRRGRKLSTLRRKAAGPLSTAVASQLRDLGFKKSEFEIRLVSLEVPGASGLETVEFTFAPRWGGFETAEFLFAPNPGEPAKPLRSIASSGEISRVMLAVKSTLAEHDSVALLVFDEIDANVGGEIAGKVGARMKDLGRGRQVLCITHLPQVAAHAATHFVVEKSFEGERTFSRLRPVSGPARVKEIARMLGGENTPSLALANELLEASRTQG